MTLEVLFARAGQGQTFLRLVVCGLIYGAIADGCLTLKGRCPALTPLWGVAAGLSLAALVLPVMLLSGEGMRLYGLLGLVIGLTLYASGAGYAIHALCRRWKKRKTSRPKAGRTHADDESL